MISFGETTDLLQVLCTLNELYPIDMNPLTVRWLSCCPTGANRWFVATDEDRIVGIYGLLPRQATVNGIIVDAHLCNNVGVVPSHRGRGIFRDLGRYATEFAGVESNVFIGCSNPAALKGHLAAGWTHIANLDLLNGCIPDGAHLLGESRPYSEQPITHKAQQRPNALAMVRGQTFRDWRYSRKMGYLTRAHRHRWAVWKMYKGRRQIMEMSDEMMLEYLDGEIDIWAVHGSEFHKRLLKCDFENVYTRHLVIKPNGSCAADPNALRFDLCDNETF